MHGQIFPIPSTHLLKCMLGRLGLSSIAFIILSTFGLEAFPGEAANNMGKEVYQTLMLNEKNAVYDYKMAFLGKDKLHLSGTIRLSRKSDKLISAEILVDSVNLSDNPNGERLLNYSNIEYKESNGVLTASYADKREEGGKVSGVSQTTMRLISQIIPIAIPFSMRQVGNSLFPIRYNGDDLKPEQKFDLEHFCYNYGSTMVGDKMHLTFWQDDIRFLAKRTFGAPFDQKLVISSAVTYSQDMILATGTILYRQEVEGMRNVDGVSVSGIEFSYTSKP